MNNVCTSNLSMGESFDDYDDDAFAKILEKIENGKIFFLVYLNMSEKKMKSTICMRYIGKLATIILYFKIKYLACYCGTKSRRLNAYKQPIYSKIRFMFENMVAL